MTHNSALLKGITDRLKRYKVDKDKTVDKKSRKLIVELFLLLYYSPITRFPSYKFITPCKYEAGHLRTLIINSRYTNLCKDICGKYISVKNKSQEQVTFHIVDDKYKNDHIWLVWNELFKIAGALHNAEFESWIKIQLDIFAMFYKKTTCVSRIYILYSIIDELVKVISGNRFRWINEDIIKRPFIEIMLKIDFIYVEVEHIKPKPRRETLHNCCMVMFPRFCHQDKVKNIYEYIPEYKDVYCESRKINGGDKRNDKIKYEKIIKVTT
jgi:hypothetical protein